MKNIRLGIYDFDLMVIEGLTSEGKPLLGEISYGPQTIRVEYNQTQQGMAVVLLHEVVHGIFTNMELNQTERTITLVSQGLALFLRDNYPEAWREIVATFDGVKEQHEETSLPV